MPPTQVKDGTVVIVFALLANSAWTVETCKLLDELWL